MTFTDDQITELIARLTEHGRRYLRFSQPCGHPPCPFMVRHGDAGWGHLDTHGATPGHKPIGVMEGAAAALAQVKAENAALRAALREAREAIGEVRGWNGLVENAQLDRTRQILSAALAAEKGDAS